MPRASASAAEKRRMKDRRTQALRSVSVTDKYTATHRVRTVDGHTTTKFRNTEGDSVLLKDVEDDSGDEKVEEENIEGGESATAKKSRAAQTREAVNAFMSRLEQLEPLIFERYENPYANETCACGSSLPRLIKCFECFQYPAKCAECFVDRHSTNPLHWARVWDPVKLFYRKQDFSSTLPSGCALQLGHDGGKCPRPSSDTNFLFTIIHTNGIHATLMKFCECHGPVDKVAQLMRAQLFPGTVSDPQTAFTFDVLKHFNLFNLQAKCGAYDFMAALCRITDNVFTENVKDHYKLLQRVSRVWDHIATKRRTGQCHGIDKHFNQRPPGNLIVYCPACPEPGVNVPEDFEAAPGDLRHLTSITLTIDGNHRCHRYVRNTDPQDPSLWGGHGYFPAATEYEAYLNGTAVESEKSVCSYITAVNSQDRKKFRGCDETGLINVQCNHNFVRKSVDMYLGERFAYSDYAIAGALDLTPLGGINVNLSYDSACSYSVNMVERFQRHIPKYAGMVGVIRFIIDSLHVHGHTLKCMYFFAAIYMIASARITGIGVEQYWAENNQLGPQTQQMNKGHRQDTIMEHHNHWNFKKLVAASKNLTDDLKKARHQYREKKRHFKAITAIFRSNVAKWGKLDQAPIIGPNREIISVFKHTESEMPSLETTFQSLLNLGQNNRQTAKVDNEPDPVTGQVAFLRDGILIHEQQIVTRLLVRRNSSHPLAATQAEVAQQRAWLTTSIESWREAQSVHMERLGALISSVNAAEPEDEALYLPSDFNKGERAERGLEGLAEAEKTLREGQACELILRLRTATKLLDNYIKLKEKHERGQKANTRAQVKIDRARLGRDRILDSYNGCRSSLISLGGIDTPAAERRFPPLDINATSRKSTVAKRARGDTYVTDGLLWELGEVSHTVDDVGDLGSPRAAAEGSMGQQLSPLPTESATQMAPRKRQRPESPHIQPRRETTEIPETRSQAREVPNLWHITTGSLSQEVEKFQIEEDRVAWFRAWADMLRWLEEYELKHVELDRTARHFERLASAWGAMAAADTRPGYAPFARRQSAIYGDLANDTKRRYHLEGEKAFTSVTGPILTKAIEIFHGKEIEWLKDIINAREDEDARVIT